MMEDYMFDCDDVEMNEDIWGESRRWRGYSKVKTAFLN